MDQLFGNVSEQLETLAVVAFAMVLGAAVGLNRERRDKPAGIRTHTLVAGASALLVEVGDFLIKALVQESLPDVLRADPFRLIGAVVTGVSFLGAGTIIRQRQHHVEGLTTAASVLFVAIIGITVAARQFVLATGCTGLVLIVLAYLRGKQSDGPPDAAAGLAAEDQLPAQPPVQPPGLT